MTESNSRHIKLEKVVNFRDIGGYRTRDGNTVAWRRVFRSGDLAKMSDSDYNHLADEIALNSVLDLRSDMETKKGICPLTKAGITYYNIPFMHDGGDREEEDRLFSQFSNMGHFYLHLVQDPEFGKSVLQALELIAEPDNHPLVFHCAVGKDRTGILAAVLLSVLGVADDDIIEDYSLSGPYMDELLVREEDNPEFVKAIERLPEYFWKAAPESMTLFLSTLQREYGSVEDYLNAQGIESSLIHRLKKALLT